MAWHKRTPWRLRKPKLQEMSNSQRLPVQTKPGEVKQQSEQWEHNPKAGQAMRVRRCRAPMSFWWRLGRSRFWLVARVRDSWRHKDEMCHVIYSCWISQSQPRNSVIVLRVVRSNHGQEKDDQLGRKRFHAHHISKFCKNIEGLIWRKKYRSDQYQVCIFQESCTKSWNTCKNCDLFE